MVNFTKIYLVTGRKKDYLSDYAIHPHTYSVDSIGFVACAGHFMAVAANIRAKRRYLRQTNGTAMVRFPRTGNTFLPRACSNCRPLVAIHF